MSIVTPAPMPALPLIDIHGNTIKIGQGRKVLLSLFREATCPFCNFRVYELTHNYPGLSQLGLDIVVVFQSSRKDVKTFIAKQPRPFQMIADPMAQTHKILGNRTSRWGKIKAMLLRMPAMFLGLKQIGMGGGATGNLMPADFLIDENGVIVETYYGNDAGDHIAMERIERFSGKRLAVA